MLFVHNAAKVAEAAGLPWIQGVWNLRDQFKQDRRTLILLGRDSAVPAELEGDVVTLDEELPSAMELRAIVRATDKAASEFVSGRPEASDSTVEQAVEAIQGLAAFPAEQAIAMAVRPDGIDLNHLWEVKRSMIEDTPGLSCWRGGEKFEDIGGLENAKRYCSQLIQGRKRYGAVVFIDEIEKLMAGSTGSDTSGVSQGFLQVLLTYMQDHNVSGMIFVGHPGAGKSMLGKALGSEAGVPTIALDTNAMKSSLVGSSEQRIRSAMKVITAVSNERPLFVATCNAIANLPPELRRRFTAGTFFFDLPTHGEREIIWDHYIEQFNLDADQNLPNDVNWTGAEIRSCCQGAWERNVSLIDASEFVVPVAKADPERIERLRKEAAGRYISASESGTYKMVEKAKAGRKMG
jgi:adenylate kinase family enzyme